ncbi:hypothetical protein GWK91_14220 [Virgibacillus sp. MSP4-1]|uniref:hypothetical protein n=1 Tax=Virgibacillus sp. MSP4-1 TaxID=2700081 RepID=UPI0003A64622|nr:hypothetical protein [Virgibacillus sp. MSP4-1]QHS24000.1 hypothetical protein GWK91_14220 [Virgibacillus sp. MSP4-1]
MNELILTALILFILYKSFRFYQVIARMKNIRFPAMEDMAEIRKLPEKPLNTPSYSHQKIGMTIYILMLVFLLIMFSIGIFIGGPQWYSFLPLLVPFVYTGDLLNLFAISNDGILSSTRFIPWKSIRSFEFVQIDVNHRYYGHSKEVNDTYELKIKTRGFPIRIVVITDEMKEKLTEILNNN